MRAGLSDSLLLEEFGGYVVSVDKNMVFAYGGGASADGSSSILDASLSIALFLGGTLAGAKGGALVGAKIGAGGGPKGAAVGVLLGMVLGGGMSFAKILYLTPASMRSLGDCSLEGGLEAVAVCRVEPEALYVLPLDFSVFPSFGREVSGQCLLFWELEPDGDGGFLRWEVDRCFPKNGFVLPGAWFSPYGQNEDGWLRIGGRTGFLDGFQGHQEVIARGVVDLDTGEAIDPDVLLDIVADGGW